MQEEIHQIRNCGVCMKYLWMETTLLAASTLYTTRGEKSIQFEM